MKTKVGMLQDNYLKIFSMPLSDRSIYAHSGTFKHIKKRHPNINNIESKIRNILANPDYVGTHPKEPNSIEYIKKIDDNYLVAVKFDKQENYLIVASLYNITEAKISSRLKTGRIIKV